MSTMTIEIREINRSKWFDTEDDFLSGLTQNFSIDSLEEEEE
jgi:hypothetical protein